MKPIVLIADEEPMFCEAISYILGGAGFEPYKVGDTEQLLSVAREKSPQLVLLSETLPNGGNPQTTSRSRKTSPSRPCCLLREDAGAMLRGAILMWGTDPRPQNRIAALNCGADDYLIKPFGMRELVARANRLVRRSGAAPVLLLNETLRAGALQLDAGARRVWLDGLDAANEIKLTPTEFDLLHFLMAYQGQVVTRETLLERMWGRPGPYSNSDRTLVDVYVGHLRRKLDDDVQNPRFIVSLLGKGFTLRNGTDS